MNLLEPRRGGSRGITIETWHIAVLDTRNIIISPKTIPYKSMTFENKTFGAQVVSANPSKLNEPVIMKVIARENTERKKEIRKAEAIR